MTRTATTSWGCGRPSWNWSPRSASGSPTRTDPRGSTDLADSDAAVRPAVTNGGGRGGHHPEPVPGCVLDEDGHDITGGGASKCRYVSHTTRFTRSVSRFAN